MNRDPKVKTTGSPSLVSNSDQVQSTITKVVEDFGKIDVFVANAGKLALISMIHICADNTW
jgi:NADP-dependent 3-hydroxy acid dehydrogenase YdfG